MAYRLLLFDMDGTILNTLTDLTDSLNRALALCGLPPHSEKAVRSFVGDGIPKLVERGVPAGSDEEIVKAVLAAFHADYSRHCADRTQPYPGIPELLRRLRAAGYTLAVLSNKADYAVAELCRRYFPSLFDLAIGQREGVPKKPHPAGVERALRETGCPPNEAVLIGDSDVDVQTAKNARIDCFAVEWGFRDRPVLEAAGADRIFSSVAALEQALLPPKG